MSRKSKLVLKTLVGTSNNFEIVKTVNTLQHGIPGDRLTKKEIDGIMKSSVEFRRGDFTIEFIKGST